MSRAPMPMSAPAVNPSTSVAEGSCAAFFSDMPHAACTYREQCRIASGDGRRRGDSSAVLLPGSQCKKDVAPEVSVNSRRRPPPAIARQPRPPPRSAAPSTSHAAAAARGRKSSTRSLVPPQLELSAHKSEGDRLRHRMPTIKHARVMGWRGYYDSRRRPRGAGVRRRRERRPAARRRR